MNRTKIDASQADGRRIPSRFRRIRVIHNRGYHRHLLCLLSNEASLAVLGQVDYKKLLLFFSGRSFSKPCRAFEVDGPAPYRAGTTTPAPSHMLHAMEDAWREPTGETWRSRRDGQGWDNAGEQSRPRRSYASYLRYLSTSSSLRRFDESEKAKVVAFRHERHQVVRCRDTLLFMDPNERQFRPRRWQDHGID